MKGESQKQVLQENKTRQFFRKTIISYPCVSGSKKWSFFEKIGMLCFLLTPVLRLALLPYRKLQIHQAYVHGRFCSIFVVDFE